MTDKKIVMRCNHCENTARFLLIDSYLHKEYEWVKNFGNAVWNITWKFLECQTCSHPTLVQSTILCEIFDDGEDGQARGFPKHGDEVNCEDLDDKIVYPALIPSTTPSPDMPEDIAKDFNEARAVFSASPRASAALLRLVIQKLCIHLGLNGDNLNHDIGVLVQEKNLPIQTQQALDSVRVIGNNAVHPAKFDVFDDDKVALKLFDLVNFIVRETITRPREIKKIYNSLPESKRTEIDARQKKKGNLHDIGISPEYYALIVSGEKTVEIRVASMSMKLIKVGHIVRFNKKLESDCQVVRIAQYNTFAEMIEQEDPRKINPRVDAETQLAAIRRIYNAEKELLGVLVFELKKV